MDLDSKYRSTLQGSPKTCRRIHVYSDRERTQELIDKRVGNCLCIWVDRESVGTVDGSAGTGVEAVVVGVEEVVLAYHRIALVYLVDKSCHSVRNRCVSSMSR